MIITAILFQFLGANQAKAFSNKNKTIISEVVSNEFSDVNAYEDEELIEETYNPESAIVNSQSQIDQYNGVLRPSVEITTQTEVATSDDLNIDMNEKKALSLQNEASKVQGNSAPVVITDSKQAISKNRDSIVEYEIQPGDSVSTIAAKFGISVNTILWENNLSSYSLIKPGKILKILPVSGVTHQVNKGENLSYIANRYDVEASKILATNNLNNANSLKIGQELIIPGGSKIYPASSSSKTAVATAQPATSGLGVIKNLVSSEPVVASNKMLWPTEGHIITQYYSWRHTGLDIANKTGTPLYAADSGTVIFAGWSNGYGYNVVIDHGGGKKTRYAHASKFYVEKGDTVSMGDTIAAMGSTGNSTGPHVHFEVIINGSRVNPLNYIK